NAGIKIECLAQGHVERADAAANRSGERPFDGDAQIARRVYGVVGQPVLELAKGLLAGEDFKPLYAALAAIRLLHCGVEDALRCAPDVPARAVAFDVRNDGVIRN